MAGRDAAPFAFVAASYLVRVCHTRARTLGELADGMRTCSDGAILLHTFRGARRSPSGAFTSDFAQWILASCHEAALAERLEAVDRRAATSVPALRDALVAPIADHLARVPEAAGRAAAAPFCFCEALDLHVPLGRSAATLRELADGIRALDLETLHHHVVRVGAGIGQEAATADFSRWIADGLGLPGVAARLDRIDIATRSLDDLRRDILGAIRGDLRP